MIDRETIIHQKSKAGRFYVKLVTKSPYFFLSYVVVGFLLILFITMQTKIDVVTTYDTEVQYLNHSFYISLNEPSISFIHEKIYLYSVKNEAVYTAEAEYRKDSNAKIQLKITSNSQELQDFLTSHIGSSIKVEIPIKKISLFKHIFNKGGVSLHE